MRVTDPQVILNGEKDLIASVQKDLDIDAVRDLLKERLTATKLSPKGGKIVVHNNDVAFRLDYEINVNGSLLFDREGNLIEEKQTSQDEQKDGQDDDALQDLADSNDGSRPDVGQEDRTDTDAPLTLEIPADDEADNDVHDSESGLEIEDLEDDSEFDQDNSDMLKADQGDDPANETDQSPRADELEDLSVDGMDELPELELEEDDNASGRDDDIVDDDISDILQESREFWEKKKE